jgi:hypothetical protein
VREPLVEAVEIVVGAVSGEFTGEEDRLLLLLLLLLLLQLHFSTVVSHEIRAFLSDPPSNGREIY